jgi:hypothetical protein
MHHKAMGETDVRTVRFGERSEYEGSRAPASHIALHGKTTTKAACRKN